MAKKSIIQRELKRKKIAEKFNQKYSYLKSVTVDAKRTDEERYSARLELQTFPRDAYPSRQVSRCHLTGRPRGTFRMFGLSRNKIRELAFRGDIPGVVLASW
jgi:small subunit ribosomal protein S14